MAWSARSLSQQPWCRTLLCSLAIFALCCVYGSTHFFRDPGSIFFDPGRAYDRFYSSTRQAEAVEYMDAVMNDSIAPFQLSNDSKPSLCASFLTVARPVDHQYIYDSVGSLLSGLTPSERSDVHLKMLFAEVDPTRHPSYNEPWTRTFLDEAYTYSDALSETMKELMHFFAEHKKLYEKGILDYTTALQRCLDTTDAPWIAVFEDDILLAEGWLARTLLALQSADNLVRGSADPDRDWLDLRLFNQERSTGWKSRSIGANNELLIAALIDIPLIFALLGLRRNTHRMPFSPKASSFIHRYTDRPTLLVISLLIIPTFISFFFQCGKASLLPPSPGLKIENFGCCSQAMVFNRRNVPAYIDFLKSEIGAAPYDLLTEFFARVTPLYRLALYPMQAQHIGLTSASGTSKENASKVWSMAFESLDPRWLRESHAMAVDKLYG